LNIANPKAKSPDRSIFLPQAEGFGSFTVGLSQRFDSVINRLRIEGLTQSSVDNGNKD
jgi:hypothetical protein